MAIDFFRKFEVSAGVEVLNCTPHPITFVCDGGDTITVLPCGAMLKAGTQEVPSGHHGSAVMVKTVFVSSPEGEEELSEIASKAPKALVVGSIISAQAYPGRVVAMTPAAGYERVPPAEKRMDPKKFTIF